MDERICVYTPPVILPFGNIYRSINRINQRILGAGMSRVYRQLGWEPTICWTYLPNTIDLRLRPDLFLVYDCADEHAAFPGLIRKETVVRMEQELFSRAGLSLTSARELFLRKKELAPDLQVVLNGADVEHFRSALDPGLTVPPELAPFPRPVIGYIGAVSPWLDQDFLAAAARTRTCCAHECAPQDHEDVVREHEPREHGVAPVSHAMASLRAPDRTAG